LNALVLAGCIAAVVALALGRAPREPASPGLRSVLEALPPDSAFVATVNVSALRRAGLLPEPKGTRTLGLDAPRTSCGFDPLDTTDVVGAFATLSPSTPIDVGFAALGPFDEARIAACVERMIRARGGEPRRTPMGTFTTIRDGHGKGGEVALRPRGPILVGGPHTLRQMLDAVEGRTESAAGNGTISALRRRVGAGGAVVAALIVDAATRDALRGALPNAPLSAIRAGAVGVHLDQVAEIRVVVVAERFGDAIATWLGEASADLTAGGPAPEGVISVRGDEIHGKWTLPWPAARRLLEQALGPEG
jgi:hypothetical protein